MPGEARVTCTIDAGVADVRLNRPDKMNALDAGMFAGLIQVGEELRANPAVRAVVLSGNGRSFCAGLDFGSFSAMAGGTADSDETVVSVNAVKPPADSPAKVAAQHCVYVWQMMPAPVIAAVHGVALGGGIQIALGADIRIVTPDVKMSVLEIRWGLIPDMTGTQMLTRLVGLDVAKELTFTGRMVDGAEAVRLGLATRVSDTPLDDALTLARDIASKSPHAVRGAKELLNMAGQVSLAEGFAAEQRVIRSLIGSPNQVEAVMSFFEKRPAVYADPN
jgi:enoyl-CoA hydratase/carnithine racemase